MKQSRIENLADGIFAIVMTLLVFEIKLPEPVFITTNHDFLGLIASLGPALGTYLVSFAFLYTFWRGHESIVSAYVRNVDPGLSRLSALFLFLVALVPASGYLLSRYHGFSYAVALFALHIVLIGCVLLWMRVYAKRAQTVENVPVSHEEDIRAYIRIIVPIFCSLVAIILAFVAVATKYALAFLTIGLLFNLSTHSSRLLYKAYVNIRSGNSSLE